MYIASVYLTEQSDSSKCFYMEKRLGAVLILIQDSTDIKKINTIISEHSELIIGRQGIPMRDRGISVISLVLEGNSDDIGSLAGKLGRIEGVNVKSVLSSQ